MSREDGLGALSALGPFFALERLPDPPSPWSPFGAFVRDPAAVRDRVEVVRGALAAGVGLPADRIEPKVASSVAHLGLVARIVSPCLALSVLDDLVVLTPDELWWQPAPHGRFPLAADPSGWTRHHDPQQWARDVVGRLLAPPAEAFGGSPEVLRGNAASAVNGAVSALRATRPDLATRLRPLAALVVSALGAGTHTGRVGEPSFRRNSCCLIYRLADGPARAVCGDCVLAQPA